MDEGRGKKLERGIHAHSYGGEKGRCCVSPPYNTIILGAASEMRPSRQCFSVRVINRACPPMKTARKMLFMELPHINCIIFSPFIRASSQCILYSSIPPNKFVAAFSRNPSYSIFCRNERVRLSQGLMSKEIRPIACAQFSNAVRSSCGTPAFMKLCLFQESGTSCDNRGL